MSKVLQASEEGGRIKRLMGALRYLYRNSFLARNIGFCFIPIRWTRSQKKALGALKFEHLMHPAAVSPGETSMHPKVSELKGLLRPSPRSKVP